MKELDTKEAGQFARAAVFDAQRRNTNNKSLYTQTQIRKALIVRDLLDSAFSYNNLYINYRKKFIAVKAEGARAKDTFSKEVVKCLEASGYGVVATQQGIIVRLDSAAV
jgi:type II secretory pathway component PulC